MGTEDRPPSVEPRESLSLLVGLRDDLGKPQSVHWGNKAGGERSRACPRPHTPYTVPMSMHTHRARLLSCLHTGTRVHMRALHGSYNLHTHIRFHPRGRSLPSWASRMIPHVCPCTRVCVHTQPELCFSPFDGIYFQSIYSVSGRGLRAADRGEKVDVAPTLVPETDVPQRSPRMTTDCRFGSVRGRRIFSVMRASV